jgi:hypothetical protein
MSSAEAALMADLVGSSFMFCGAAIAVVAFVLGWACNFACAFADGHGQRMADRVDDRVVERIAALRIAKGAGA